MFRFIASTLLSVLVLLTQQAALRHGLAHLASDAAAAHRALEGQGVNAQAHHDDPADPDGHAPASVCKECVAFAQVDSAVHIVVATPALLAGLRFHAVASPLRAAQDTACPPPRSRGPPVLG